MLAFQGVLQHRLGGILGRFGRGGTFERTDDPYWIKVRYRAYAPEDHWFPVRDRICVSMLRSSPS